MTQAGASSTDTDWKTEIAALEHAANDAFVARDLARLDQLFSDDLVVNSPINVVNDKRKILDLLGSGVIGHVSSTIEHELVRRDGDFVVVMGADAVRNTDAEPMLRRRFTNVWRREGDRWRLYVRHANIVADAPAASATRKT
ncbi:MAG TPA: nuclear transport factor 2 family protein [Casimicrobiaceae bacterium]|nr:nuclear transport factor 2 family protein [Casimicrobiaceae bacterium]